MGEGWGLCNFEAAAIGIPQIVPAIGGFLDFFDSESAILIKPKIKLYTDMTIDGCPGCAEICDAIDFADAIDMYYADDSLRKQHAENARKRIVQNYKWNDLGEKLYVHVCNAAGKEPVKEQAVAQKNTISIDELELLSENLKDNLNIESLTNAAVVPEKVKEVVSEEKARVQKNPQSRKEEIRARLRNKLAKKQSGVGKRKKIPVIEESSSDEDIDLDKEKLLKLKQKIDRLLGE